MAEKYRDGRLVSASVPGRLPGEAAQALDVYRRAMDAFALEEGVAADGLVTDASSVWIDYLLTQRPIIFAFPDIEEYRQRRGLNLAPTPRTAPGSSTPSLSVFLDIRKGKYDRTLRQ